MKKVLLILTVTSFFSLSTKAQIQQGLRSSNYGGINSLQLNPSSFQYSPLKWDFNIVSGGLFFENEYLFIENTNLIEVMGHDGDFLFRSTSPEAIVQNDDPDALYYNFFNANSDINNSINAFAGLPSIAFRIDKYSFGVFANLRSAIGLTNLDADLDYFSLDRWNEGQEKTIDPVGIAGMQWAEVGINAAMKLKETEFNKWYAGINLKYLRGFDGFYLNSNENTTVTEVNDTLSFSGGPYNYGIASGSLNGEGLFKGNGNGAGIDLGFTFIRKNINKSKPYLWKIGASIVDLGFVHFNKNTQDHLLQESDLYTADKPSIVNATSALDLLQIVSEQTTGNPNQTLVADNFTLYTPAMLSIQFDYSLSKEWYVSAQLNRRLNLSERTVDRENILASSLRYEKRNWEIGIPITLFEDHDLRMGLWARFYFLTIGSDHLQSIFINDPHFTGSDVYFAIKINPFSGKRKTGVEDCNF